MSEDLSLFLTCRECQGILSNGDERMGPDGNVYCEDCYDDYFASCDCCRRIVSRDTVTGIGPNGDEVYCEDCANVHAFYCAHCDTTYSRNRRDSWRLAESREYVCDNCYESNYCTCDNCGYAVHYDNVCSHEDEDDCYCPDCWEGRAACRGPQNPPVTKEDRETILALCSNWLQNKQKPIYCLTKSNDMYLAQLSQLVGMIEAPVYVYGIKDNHGCDFWCAPEYYDKLADATADMVSYFDSTCKVKILQSSNPGIGISYIWRSNQLHTLANIIKKITQRKEESVCVA